ncbi:MULTISPECIES: sigma-70 family RNA polymerase sigma factor [Streptomyces]|uniref:Sigma-70 family RNA polymerase sigma factor n=1 Tax=Streptomyces chengmaiensis TaxID=3040919 RepID=A0ABT6HSL1_9ACTN|nr:MULTISPECIES: sigma-70 family RNA polymerase sigma factor [Streptomyces]MDH2391695.1 sigma-70 family RNA polymerase sigma factor [Streptomyces chengmaiensis]WRQ79483.1 sigma-70 family RNA polymerase sigma factor [Streptomyces sp. MUM 178J]
MAGLWSRGRRSSTDEALIRSLYEEHGNALLAYATRLTGDRGAAEDVVQETLIRAWRHSESLVNGKGSVRGWLLTVARNIVTDRYRAKAARPAEVAESPTTGPVAEDHAEAVVDSMAVLGALDQLTAEHRDVLVELYFREHTVAETAQALGIPAGTVKSRSHYALKALRDAYANSPAGPGGSKKSSKKSRKSGKTGGRAKLQEVAA